MTHNRLPFLGSLFFLSVRQQLSLITTHRRMKISYVNIGNVNPYSYIWETEPIYTTHI